MLKRPDVSERKTSHSLSDQANVRSLRRTRARQWRRWRRRMRLGLRPVGGVATPLQTVRAQKCDLEVRLAQSHRDIRKAQRLRFEVFYNEMSASASATTRWKRRDIDQFDAICDHLLVVDRKPASRRSPWSSQSRVVGTYRMLRQEVAAQHSGFYSQAEFDLEPLIASRGPDCKFLELGRSCVLEPYRTSRTVELLWQGLWSYIRRNDVSVMIGCASFAGVDPNAHASALSFLHHTASAPPEWSARAHDNRRVDMNILPASDINSRQVIRTLPPLIKGYLRLGCFVGDGAVVDEQFGTTDVLMILPIDRIAPRYTAHFGTPAERRNRDRSGRLNVL